MATVSTALSAVAHLTVRRCVTACLLACLAVFGLDALLFRTGLYLSILEPDSSTGQFEFNLRRERQVQSRFGDNLVITLGNSRFAWSPKVVDNLAVKPPYVFRDGTIGGSDPRMWYYFLRDLDPTARRYRAIVIGVDDYDDEDRLYSPDDEIGALHYAIARLRLSDTLEFARSFHSREVQWQAFRGALLKGLVYQADIQAFLSHPRKRLEYVRQNNRDGASWEYDFLAPTTSLAGLKVDWSTLAVTYPPGVDRNTRDTVESFIAHTPDPQTGRLATFRRIWLGRTIDRYRGSPTKIIFLRLARGPIPRPDNLVHKLSASIREMASRPNVMLADEHAFESLEHPELFRDGMHLNREGVNRFSQMMAEEVSRMLGPPFADRAARPRN